MKEILLIRHGETDWNAQGRLQGTLDTPLNGNGIRQAGIAAKALKGHGIQIIYASPMLRARKTAELIAEETGASLIFRESLREKDFGAMQGMSPKEIDAVYGDVLHEMRSVLDLAPNGSESNREVMLRLQPVIDEINAVKERVLIVTHGAVARILYRMLAKPTEDEFHQFRLENCEILRFTPSEKGAYVCQSISLASSEVV